MLEERRIPAGWYADGSGNDTVRWWDGQEWTHDVRAASAPALMVAAQNIVRTQELLASEPDNPASAFRGPRPAS